MRATFEAPAPLTVGVEEELLLLDPETLDLVPRAREALELTGGDPRFKLELPASQLEIVVPAAPGPAEIVDALRTARHDLAKALDGRFVLAGAGGHPFADPLGEMNTGERYDVIVERFGVVARAQLVTALQVHVAVRGAERALAVYNALRGYMPFVAAIGANAAVYAGRDTGLASVRPKVCDLLPRQGVAPVIASWEAHEATLAALGDPGEWWWELRPHPRFGTLEVRVPDTQTTIADAAAIVAVVHALAAWLVARHDAGEELPVLEDWVIGEDRWHACRSGASGPLRPRVLELLDELEDFGDMAPVRALVGNPGWQRQRARFAEDGPRGVASQIAAGFLEG